MQCLKGTACILIPCADLARCSARWKEDRLAVPGLTCRLPPVLSGSPSSVHPGPPGHERGALRTRADVREGSSGAMLTWRAAQRLRPWLQAPPLTRRGTQ